MRKYWTLSTQNYLFTHAYHTHTLTMLDTLLTVLFSFFHLTLYKLSQFEFYFLTWKWYHGDIEKLCFIANFYS